MSDPDLLFSASERSSLLLGRAGIKRLSEARIAVFGLGGVGGMAAEALCRSHIGALTLIDADVLSASNLNRQIISDYKSIGQSKVKQMAERLRAINPAIQLELREEFISTDSNLDFLIGHDYVVDCIDTVSAKIAIASYCDRQSLPLIACMGTARRLDPSRLRCMDLFDTKNDPLCRVMRRELRKRGISRLEIVASDEAPQGVSPNCFPGEKRLGSLIFVPATAGLRLASEVIFRLAAPLKDEALSDEERVYLGDSSLKPELDQPS
ncbi:MAG: tRNA threonylcarbamoyladenosine dehydratase [Eubacteriales bacterium]|nr:tRNA threonylcarbamoyladenosine dehydratase [Eubacteriales bacterium]